MTKPPFPGGLPERRNDDMSPLVLECGGSAAAFARLRSAKARQVGITLRRGVGRWPGWSNPPRLVMFATERSNIADFSKPIDNKKSAGSKYRAGMKSSV